MVTGSLFLCSIVSSHFLPVHTHQMTTDEAITYFNALRFSQFSLTDRDLPHHLPRIIVIGTSLTRNAFFFDGEMEDFARKNGFTEIKFMRIVKPGATLADFTPLLDFITNAEPDAVFLESNMFVLDFNAPARNKLRSMIGTLLPGRKEQYLIGIEDNFASHKELPQEGVQRQTHKDIAFFREFRSTTRLRRFMLPDAYITFFDTLKRRGIPVVMLDLTRSPEAASAYPPGIMDAVPQLIRRYQDTYGLQYLEFPYSLGLQYYSDFAHMNERGRTVYCRWFLSELPNVVMKAIVK